MQVTVQVRARHALPSYFPDCLVTVLVRLCHGSLPAQMSQLCRGLRSLHLLTKVIKELKSKR